MQDYALGMDLKAIRKHAVYVNETVCEGEAPHAVIDSFQQRCRWAMVSYNSTSLRYCPYDQ